MKHSTMDYRKLGQTELRVSSIGFGSSPFGDVFSQTDPSEDSATVHFAVDHGIDFFDVSPYYGATLAESRLGKALEGLRHRVVLATKCGRYGADVFDFSAQRVSSSVDESLLRLRTDYIDLLQVHDVEFGDVRQIVEETIPAMRALQEQGKVRYIGITGYSLPPMLRIAEQAPVDTILTYCRYNLMITDMEEKLLPFARARGVGVINASPLHMGILTSAAPPAWHPAPADVQEAGKRVMELCRDRGYNGSEVAIRFCLDQPEVASTLIGMASREQVSAALRAFQMSSDIDLLNEIHALLRPVLNYVWPSGRLENHG